MTTPVKLHIQTVMVGNDHTDKLEAELYATAAICFDVDSEHFGIHFITSGDDVHSRNFIEEQIENSGFPYEIVS